MNLRSKRIVNNLNHSEVVVGEDLNFNHSEVGEKDRDLNLFDSQIGVGEKNRDLNLNHSQIGVGEEDRDLNENHVRILFDSKNGHYNALVKRNDGMSVINDNRKRQLHQGSLSKYDYKVHNDNNSYCLLYL